MVVPQKSHIKDQPHVSDSKLLDNYKEGIDHEQSNKRRRHTLGAQGRELARLGTHPFPSNW